MSAYETQGFRLDDSGRRVVVDPITRIEGHMRCEVNLDENNVIRNAVSSGTMWRGLEVILKGRDPRDAWAFVERICGVCTGCHALASVKAVEDALSIRIPKNAHLIREMMAKVLQVHDHAVHFYHLHALDWVDVISALKADPKATSQLAQSISKWPRSSPGYFRDIQNRLKRFVESGQLGPFMNGYWGNPAYKMPPEANLLAVTHYLEALDLQKDWVKIHTIFGGKNPHPNYMVGGVPCAINLDDTGAVGAINMERLNFVRERIEETIKFCQEVLVPDVLAIGTIYKNAGWLYGGGLAATNVIDYGDYPKINYDKRTDQLPGGAILNGNWNEIHDVDPSDPEQIQEFVTHSWYRYTDDQRGLHPWDGVTEVNYALGPHTKGTRTRIEELDESAKYSWIKAPRWRGHAMEVGPLSRYILGYAHAMSDPNRRGADYVKHQIDEAAVAINRDLPRLLGMPETSLTPQQLLPTTIGRTLARALEAQFCAEMMMDDWNELVANLKAGDRATANVDKWDPSTWAREAKGVGLVAAPRGALGHWIRIRDGKIENYQCVVPTTWNGSPRDPKGQIGAFEASLMNTPMAKADEPVEILRTLHSFDPCLACSTHVMSPDGDELSSVTIR